MDDNNNDSSKPDLNSMPKNGHCSSPSVVPKKKSRHDSGLIARNGSNGHSLVNGNGGHRDALSSVGKSFR